MNRILQHLHHNECPCVTATQRLDALNDECLSIEATCEGAIEFVTPGLSSYLEGKRRVGMFVAYELDEAEMGSDLAAHAIQQLRGVALELTAAAERLEASAGKGGAA